MTHRIYLYVLGSGLTILVLAFTYRMAQIIVSLLRML